MKKIIGLFLVMIAIACVQLPSQAGFIAKQKAHIEQNKVYKSTLKEIKKVIERQDFYANGHNYDGLLTLYSKDFVNSDGFDRDIYFKLIKDTWEIYPDITYKTDIKNIQFTDNYATVFVTETAYATPKEKIGEYETVGELYSVSKCVYHLEKYGESWLISSEKIIEENSTLKYGEARYIDIELNAPKQIGSGKSYTATLKINRPVDAVASISKERIVYPQTKNEDAFRKMNDNTLERVFISNKDNVNEYAVASVGITHTENYDEKNIKVYLSGMAFIITRINIIPENKFIEVNDEQGK